MPLQSMTGFARESGQLGDISWVWELRSVNSKSLDTRFRFPPGFDAVEQAAKTATRKQFKRGNIQASLQVKSSGEQLVPQLNEDAFFNLHKQMKGLSERLGEPAPALVDLIAVKGLVELAEPEAADITNDERDTALIASFEQALVGLEKARIVEGQGIVSILQEIFSNIADLKTTIDADPSRGSEQIFENFKAQVSKLLDVDDRLDEARLHQEAAMLAVRADIREELDRLSVHIENAEAMLKSDGPVGRQLDFLSQEFNRECNTICSKSNSSQVTARGLDMKVLIDQFREQVQNLE